MPPVRPVLRFGVFEVDVAARTLRRNGALVKLQDQPFDILIALLENPGRLLTKDELRERIWGGETFVDYDHSLATAVNKIRRALGDSATNPRFIETVPRQGYRFLAEVRAAETDAPSASRRRLGPAAVVAAAALVVWAAAGRGPGVDEAPLDWSAPIRITSDAGVTYEPAISADGSLIAYASDRAGAGDLDIWVQRVSGGEAIRITDDPADESDPHLSPDGALVAYRSERGKGGVYVKPVSGGEPRLISEQAHRPRFSPDGRWIAYFTGIRAASALVPYVSGNGVYIVPAQGGSPRRIPVDAEIATGPVWAPDSSSLLVQVQQVPYATDEFEWRVIDLDGRDHGPTGAGQALRALGEGYTFLLSFVGPRHWHSDGFVYFTIVDHDSEDLWRIRINSDQARVAGPPERVLQSTASYRNPSLSNDGRMVFADLTINPDVWSLSVDANRGVVTGANPLRLTSSPASEYVPSVSADGRLTAFSSNGQVWVLDTISKRTASLRSLSGKPVIDKAGKRVAATSIEGGLTIADVDGKVLSHSPGKPRYPWSWSWDGNKLLFNTRYDGEPATVLLDITTGRESTILFGEDKAYHQVEFSPDDRWISWRSDDGIWVAKLTDERPIPRSKWIAIESEEPGSFDKPRWAPNGNIIYYVSSRDGFHCLYARFLDSLTKRPKGQFRDIYHSHKARRSISNLAGPLLEIDVARDKIVFGMAEVTGNIWMMEPHRPE